MAQSPSQSVIIVGGGIVGLTTAVVLQAHGHAVTVVSRDRPEDTASGVAAGMIAPALEAMNDPNPAESYARLGHAAGFWFYLRDSLPTITSASMAWTFLVPSWFLHAGDGAPSSLEATGAALQTVAPELLTGRGAGAGLAATAVDGEGLFTAATLLRRLHEQFLASGGTWLEGDVQTVRCDEVRLQGGGWRAADHVVVAAGFGGHDLRQQVPALKALSPVKGHLLELPEQADYGVMRAATGYLASGPGGAKFGATMEAGRDDTRIDDAQVEGLKVRALALFPDLDMSAAVPRAGVRAASPDGWPMIGRDRTSGVLVATAMRRNGYVFAPLAARMILDLIEGHEPPEQALYDPNRF